MNILFVGGRFEDRCYGEVVAKTKTAADDAGNLFQTRLVRGFKEAGAQVYELSAPLVGPWPTVYQDLYFRGFADARPEESGIRYVAFNNVWGFRNLSRARALKQAVRAFLAKGGDKDLKIVVYQPHTPFLEAAVYAKKLVPAAHIHLVVTDLPQYMNLSSGKKSLYWFFKSFDLYRLRQLIARVDSFTLLTKYMAQDLQVGGRPYTVVEGLADLEKAGDGGARAGNGRTVAYAGRLYEAFGVKRLVEAFRLLPDLDARLVLCGGGELKGYVAEAARQDRRIEYRGVVPLEQAQALMRQAAVLVNPRPNEGEYTKYSFPSKNIEYLLSGNAVVAYMLDGVPEVYRQFFFVPQDDTVQSLCAALQRALEEPPQARRQRNQAIRAYFAAHCTPRRAAERIMALMA